jgi:hypothetical protein
LTLYAFPRITSLDAVGKLHNLKKLHLSTPPGYDASRQCYEVASFEPLATLANLETLTMRYPNNSRDSSWRAAEIYEKKLKDPGKARELYVLVPSQNGTPGQVTSQARAE